MAIDYYRGTTGKLRNPKIKPPKAVRPVNQYKGAPPAPKVKAPKVPTAAPAPTTPVTPDPRDAQYYGQMAKLQFQNNQSLNQNDLENSYDDVDVKEALRRRVQPFQDTLHAAKANANKAGLFYSGHLGKQLGDIETQEGQAQADIGQGYERRKAARAAARQAIELGAPVDEAALLAEAVDRQSTSDINNPPPVAEPTANPIMGKLHGFNQQAKAAKGDANTLRNIASYWKAHAAELKKQGLPVPAAAAALRKYL